jgi:precorrin-2 dehydrogenase / sirohydrochlorin ferrochelatase
MQPLFISFSGKKVVIAGGGRIAARKAAALSEEHANITFVAPDFRKEVLELAREKGYSLVKRKAISSDFNDAFLVILATNSPEVNKSLADTLSPNQLVSVVNEQTEGNITFPATIKRGQLQLAITTNGASPKLTKKLKSELEEQFDETWTQYTEFLFLSRSILKKIPISEEEKKQRLVKLLDERFRLDIEAQRQELEELSTL